VIFSSFGVTSSPPVRCSRTRTRPRSAITRREWCTSTPTCALFCLAVVPDGDALHNEGRSRSARHALHLRS
jgi:hypothetical protein